MTYWIYGLPYQPIDENQPSRRFISIGRIKFIAAALGLTIILILSGYSIASIIVFKTKQQYSTSETTSTIVKQTPTPTGMKQTPTPTTTTTGLLVTRPILPICNIARNKISTCPLPTGIPVYNKIGEVIASDSSGSRYNQLNNPSDIFLDKKSSLYIADTGNHRILKYLKNTKDMTVVAQGSGAYSELNAPTSLFVDECENIYVVDNQNNLTSPLARSFYRVFMYWPKPQKLGNEYEGTLLLNGSPGESYGIYLDSELNIYISVSNDPDINHLPAETYGAGKIVKWLSPNYNESIIVIDRKRLHMRNDDRFGFFPKSIYIDQKNDLYVIDWLVYSILAMSIVRHNIIKWSENAAVNLSFSIPAEPIDITMDCNSNIYIIDVKNRSVQFYPPVSTFMRKGIIIVDIQSANEIYLGTATSIAVDSRNGDIYIGSKDYNYVQKFTIEKYFNRSNNTNYS